MTQSSTPTDQVPAQPSEAKSYVDELKQYQDALAGYIKTLEGYAGAAESHGLHFFPRLVTIDDGTQIVVDVLNPTPKDGAQGITQMDPVPATFFYEAFQVHLPDIFETAVSRAQGSVGEKIAELQTQLKAQKADIAATEKELAKLAKKPRNKGNNKP